MAFLTKRTIGTGLLGWGWGYGLVLRRLEGEGRWSAPSYFRIRKLSLGFILGKPLPPARLLMPVASWVSSQTCTEGRAGWRMPWLSAGHGIKRESLCIWALAGRSAVPS